MHIEECYAAFSLLPCLFNQVAVFAAEFVAFLISYLLQFTQQRPTGIRPSAHVPDKMRPQVWAGEFVGPSYLLLQKKTGASFSSSGGK